MKIVLNNYKFEYDLALKMLKTRYKTFNLCPISDGNIKEVWDDIHPLTFKEIASLKNIEERRIGFLYYGIENMIKEVSPKLINKEVIKKTNKWLNPSSLREEIKEIYDIYELYEIEGKHFGKDQWGRDADNQFFVKCWCTSTNREYCIWISKTRAASNKIIEGQSWRSSSTPINAIDAIAWTFKTNVKKEAIEYWIRQGDCLLAKILPEWEDKEYLGSERHLEATEYLEKLKYES